MKRVILLSAVLLILCGCGIMDTVETEEKFRDAPELYPELTFVTVDELKERLTNDSHSYKIIIYDYTFYNHW